MPWYVPSLIVGAIGCAFAALFAIVIVNSALVAIALGGFGFLVSSLTVVVLLFVPDKIGVRKGIAIQGQQSSNLIQPFETAKLAVEAAQLKYDELTRLHALKTKYDEATTE